ncbi:vesicle transport through interaction with t-SNAREs homolog 1B [Microplitis demolitor]|uniref:vesicle transport through interaction with t-SNAREs homolog 1B n=1 Tax=Microplitis demolitor TaxID=69319 RepID=UPI0004CCB9E8|nr:vesicle transport through interaction with t-SNAREs homolog 1B [Microplitis demolitor]XP_053598280.1 vesicle transport through interaction with t-SNAREs homolog 1B [Microplitis demolitor]XP_053598283.1 vesicle transport through interaction with t-SNAREs homolog 1B [Microplitis demolitor]XP_053598287.1 vesicle transport through interaction with t-SNAREs homolog 1B [Microplitis demolitor]XP_053598289.1 vesicle transport through interaction with t-SNAREs homolog 1B [Microplitis demolitor]XP_05
MNYGIDWETEQRQTLLGTRATLERSAQSVARSQTVAAETEQIGQEVVAELGIQRETLLRTKRRLSETDQELATSRKIMRLIGRRVLTNKIVLILIIILEIAILGIVIYLKFFTKK